jgi:hypothetical protein
MRKLFSSFAVEVPVSDEYVTTGLIIVLYVFFVTLFNTFSLPTQLAAVPDTEV